MKYLNIACVAVVILFVFALFSAKGQVATLDAGTLVVDKFFFGADKHEVLHSHSIITNLDPTACDTALPAIVAAVQADELADAGRVNRNNWVPQSSAMCIKSTYEIPSDTVISQGTVCTLVRDTALTIEEQLAQCSTP